MRKNNIFEILLAMVLLTTFVGCSVYMVLLGANAYRNMVDETKLIDNERIALSFVENQIRMSESYEDIGIEVIDGVECIVINNPESKHLIYVKDAYLNELIVKKDAKAILDGGESIVECDDLKMEIDDHQCTITLEINDELKTKHIALR